MSTIMPNREHDSDYHILWHVSRNRLATMPCSIHRFGQQDVGTTALTWHLGSLQICLYSAGKTVFAMIQQKKHIFVTCQEVSASRMWTFHLTATCSAAQHKEDSTVTKNCKYYVSSANVGPCNVQLSIPYSVMSSKLEHCRSAPPDWSNELTFMPLAVEMQVYPVEAMSGSCQMLLWHMKGGSGIWALGVQSHPTPL